MKIKVMDQSQIWYAIVTLYINFVSSILCYTKLLLLIIGNQNENDDQFDDAYDGAYENLQSEIVQPTKMNQDHLIENPYYEKDFDLEHVRSEKKSSKIVNLEDAEVVTAAENIYYDLWVLTSIKSTCKSEIKRNRNCLRITLELRV